MIRRFIVAVLLLAALIPTASAITVVVNSDDWLDVYSGMQYAILQGHNAKFMTSKQYTILLPQIIPRKEPIIVIESQRVPFTINLAGNLERAGYSADTIYVSGGRAANIELARRLDVTRFIVIDPAYGYNAISVIPYAQITGAYVLFGDNRNVDQILSFLSGRTIESLLVYGQIDPRLAQQLARYSPEVINLGNRYKDNAEILKRFVTRQPAAQLLLTDGSIIEDELMRAGSLGEVTLLIGKDAVPESVTQFLSQSSFRSAVLVGNHLTQSAKRLKDATGIPVFVKFGQGITRGTEAEPVKALDMFPLPVVDLELVLRKLQYNTLTKNVEITYDNRGIRTYVKTSAGILANDERVLAVGDQDVQRIETNQTRGFQYPADLTQYVADQADLQLDLFTLYGESQDTLDHAIVVTSPLPAVTIQDDCELTAKRIQYNRKTQRFILELENEAPVQCFASIELRDLIVDDQPTSVPYPEIALLDRGDTLKLEIKQRMTDVDLADNPEIRLRVRYGERSDFLLSVLEVRLPLGEYAGFGISTTGLLIGVIALLIIIIIVMFFVLRKRRKFEWR